EPMVALGIVGACILIPLFVISLRWTRGLLTGWLFFFVAMLPTMQIIGFSEVIAADKFAYLPSVGLLMVLTSFLVWLIGSSKVRAKFAVRISVVTVIVLALAGTEAVATRRQLTHWRDTAGYYEHMLTLTPDAAVLHYGLGIELQSQGEIDEAINRYRRAIEIRPYYAEAHYNLATALRSQENIDEAMSHYRQAIRIKPDYAQAHYNLAMALESQGELDKAISCYYEALKYRPDDIESHNNVGIIFVSQGRFDDAINHFRCALQARADDAKSHFNLGIALKSQGKLDEAIEHFLQALQTNPNFAEAHNHLGIVLAKTGRLNGALKHFQEALRLRPDWPVPLIGIARILALHPDPKVRDTDRAVSFAERADRLTKNKNPAVLNTLAEVYAAAGRYDSAIATAQTALDLASAAKTNELAERIRRQLERYRQAKP
ncbi:MAG: tetratricopeptide repeat protein, partial [Sedimentisphaerales bacterium]